MSDQGIPTNIEYWLQSSPRVMEPPQGTVLAVSAHPDDIESEYAGTLALAAAAGADVRLLLVTSGDEGDSKGARGWDTRVIGAREIEALQAARVLGISEVVFLRYADGAVENTIELRRDIVRGIRTWRPDSVFAYDPLFTLPLYISHPDHRAVGRATLDAVYPLARYSGAFPDQLAAGLEVHHVASVWMFASAFGSAYVDIAAVLERKIEARIEHGSQVSDPSMLRANWERRAESTGQRVGLNAAEAFTIIDLG